MMKLITVILLVLVLVVVACGIYCCGFLDWRPAESKETFTVSSCPLASTAGDIVNARKAVVDQVAEDELANSADVDRAEILEEGFTTDQAVKGGTCTDSGYEGHDFQDWLESSAIDTKTMESHNEWVAKRLADPAANNVGRAYTPDRHDTYDAIPWVGLRRPQAVPIGNPTQVPDIDLDRYDTEPRFTWRSA